MTNERARTGSWLLLSLAVGTIGCDEHVRIGALPVAVLDLAATPADLAVCAPPATALGPATPGQVSCGVEACAGSFCCVASGGNVCQPIECAGGAIAFACDGPEDCPDGQACCLDGARAACSSTCAGTTVCHASSDCATGLECDARVDVPPGAGGCGPPRCG